MNRRDRRRRGQTAGRRRKGKGSPYAIIVDSVTGERFVPVDDFVHFVRTREKPGITKLEVIRACGLSAGSSATWRRRTRTRRTT